VAIRELLTPMRGRPPGERPVSLVPAAALRVKFSGDRAAEGPLTLGQRNTWPWVTNTALYTRMTDWALDLPRGATLGDIAAAWAVLMARHESLRTTYSPGGDVQRVAGSGELPIEVFEVPGGPASGAELAVRLVAALRAREFDLTADLPVRVAVACSDGVPQAAAAVYSHMAVDFASMAIVGAQFTRLAADPASREPGPRGHQPLDQAAAEASPRGQQRAKLALRSLRSRLEVMPPCMHPVPVTPGESGPASAWLWSPAAALALPHISARTGGSAQSAVLAAVCALLSLRSGHQRCMLTGPVTNRYEAALRGYVGSLARDTVIAVDTGAAGYDELVRRAGAASLKAARSALVDRAGLLAAIGEIEHARGIAYARDCVYNDISAPAAAAAPPHPPGDPAQARAALARTGLYWTQISHIDELLLLVLAEVTGELILGAVTRDTSRMPRAEIEMLLRGVEALLVAAAAGDVGHRRLREVTGVAPLARGPGWLRVNSYWVELAEVRRLVSDVAGGRAGHVFAVDGPDGEPILVAYLAAGPRTATPEHTHQGCLALLPRHGRPLPPGAPRFTAMTPARYVICDGAPADPADLAGWQRRRVIADGSGRGSA
jgi:hypothetical protein